MSTTGANVFIAMSGGVDSSTSAALLLEQGYRCSGVFMITNEQANASQQDAENVAKSLGIKLFVLDLRKEFSKVLDYFADEYKHGRTPNPCVFCNRYIKFGRVWDFAKDNGADLFATGHYARVIQTKECAALYESKNTSKDQSYVLSMVQKDVFEKLLLPLGEFNKTQVRELCGKFGLGVQHKAESQEICFITNDDYVSVLENLCPELSRKGKIIDSSGKLLGEHNGIHRFTIGQRRGLKVAMGEPYYVTKLDSIENTVTLGPKHEVMKKVLTASDVNWLWKPDQNEFEAKVKIRYNHRGAAATVRVIENNEVEANFFEPVSAITPGQLAVFYVSDENGQRVAGSGWIKSVRQD